MENYVLALKGSARLRHSSLLLAFHWAKQTAWPCINSRRQKGPRSRGKPGIGVSSGMSTTTYTVLLRTVHGTQQA